MEVVLQVLVRFCGYIDSRTSLRQAKEKTPLDKNREHNRQSKEKILV